MGLYLGIDGGGTKTVYILADEFGQILTREVSRGIDYNQIGSAGVKQEIENALSRINSAFNFEVHDLSAVAAGIPCFGEDPAWDNDCVLMFQSLFKNVPHICVNDVIIAMHGSLGSQPGIHIVSGTGSIAVGQNEQGEIARSGGWSEHFSDEGSCYWLGQRAVSLFTKQSDGRLTKNDLYYRIKKALHITNDYEIINYYRNHLLGKRQNIADLQIILYEAAYEGDPSAIRAYEEAALELAQLAMAIKNKLFADYKRPVNVSYSGGLFKGSFADILPLEMILEKENCKLINPLFPPEKGALLMAYELNKSSEMDWTQILTNLAL